MAQQNCPEFKLIIIGDNHVGKKELVDISPPLVGGNEKKHVPSLGVDVHSLSFLTNRGPIKFNVWDSAGGQYDGTRDGYYIQGQCAIIMFDVRSRITYKNIPYWYRDLTRVCGGIPVVLVGNYVRSPGERKIKPKQVTFHRDKNDFEYLEIDTTSNYDVEKPFLHLARMLSGDSKLFFLTPIYGRVKSYLNYWLNNFTSSDMEGEDVVMADGTDSED